MGSNRSIDVLITFYALFVAQHLPYSCRQALHGATLLLMLGYGEIFIQVYILEISSYNR